MLCCLISEKVRAPVEITHGVCFISKLYEYERAIDIVFMLAEAILTIVTFHYPQKVTILSTEFMNHVYFDYFSLKF